LVLGARVLAVFAGLDLGLGWVPADGVSARLAAAVAAVALLVVVTGRPAGTWARRSRPDRGSLNRGRLDRSRLDRGRLDRGRLDTASLLALGTTILAGIGATFAPPDLGPDPARAAWLVAATAAAVAMLGLTVPVRPALVAGGHRLPAMPAAEHRGGDQSTTRSYT
jgi:hypothetical protein